MSDLISRQAAIDAIIADKIEDGLPVITDTQERDFEVFNSSCDRHAKILKELPSAQVERKSGEWFIEPNKGNISCSICKEEFSYYPSIGIKPIWDYCPYCGARMGEQDEG